MNKHGKGWGIIGCFWAATDLEGFCLFRGPGRRDGGGTGMAWLAGRRKDGKNKMGFVSSSPFHSVHSL